MLVEPIFAYAVLNMGLLKVLPAVLNVGLNAYYIIWPSLELLRDNENIYCHWIEIK